MEYGLDYLGAQGTGDTKVTLLIILRGMENDILGFPKLPQK